jgi:hypothetical protein
LAGLCGLFSSTLARFAECAVTLLTGCMACHRSTVRVLAEAGGGDIERRNEELKETGLGSVGAAGMVAPLLRSYNDV